MKFFAHYGFCNILPCVWQWFTCTEQYCKYREKLETVQSYRRADPRRQCTDNPVTLTFWPFGLRSVHAYISIDFSVGSSSCFSSKAQSYIHTDWHTNSQRTQLITLPTSRLPQPPYRTVGRVSPPKQLWRTWGPSVFGPLLLLWLSFFRWARRVTSEAIANFSLTHRGSFRI